MWKTADGRKVKESEMSDSHVVNALTYIVRREQERLYFRDQYEEDYTKLHATCDTAKWLMDAVHDGEKDAKLVLSDFAEEHGFAHLAEYLRGFVHTYKWDEAVRRVSKSYMVLANVADTRRLPWRTDPLEPL